MTTTFYTNHSRPTILYVHHSREKLPPVGSSLLLLLTVLKHLFEAWIRYFFDGYVELPQSDVTIIILSIIIAIGDAVQMFPESVVRNILDAVVIL